MNIKLSNWQKKVWLDTHRFIVISAGRRVGKTTLSAIKMIDFATKNEKVNVWYLSPTYRQSEQIMWRMLNSYLPKHAIAKKNETKLEIELTNGSRIELKGADTDPDALRGVRIDYLICDEVASFRNWAVVWSEVLRPTLIDSQGKAIFIGTPRGFNHFYNLYNEQDNDKDYISYKFTSYDNPFIPSEEIDKAKQELTEEAFMQEFMADFRTFTGLVHKPFDRSVHVIEPFDIPREWQRIRGFDFGSTHYTGSVRIAVTPEDFWIVDSCYLDGSRQIEDHAKAILTQDYGLDFIPAWGDPSGGQWFAEFAKYNVFIEQARKDMNQSSKSWVEFCVEKINERLKRQLGTTLFLPNGEVIQPPPRLLVLNNESNQPLIKQFENLKWRTMKSGGLVSMLDESDDPVGGHYDLLAALRYVTVSYEKPTQAMRDVKNDFSSWAL